MTNRNNLLKAVWSTTQLPYDRVEVNTEIFRGTADDLPLSDYVDLGQPLTSFVFKVCEVKNTGQQAQFLAI